MDKERLESLITALKMVNNDFTNIINSFKYLPSKMTPFIKASQDEEFKKHNEAIENIKNSILIDSKNKPLDLPAIDNKYQKWLIDSIKPANQSEKAIVLSDFLKNYIIELKPEPLMTMVNSTLYNAISNLVLLNRKASIFDKFSYKELSCDICEKKRKDKLQEIFKKFL